MVNLSARVLIEILKEKGIDSKFYRNYIQVYDHDIWLGTYTKKDFKKIFTDYWYSDDDFYEPNLTKYIFLKDPTLLLRSIITNFGIIKKYLEEFESEDVCGMCWNDNIYIIKYRGEYQLVYKALDTSKFVNICYMNNLGSLFYRVDEDVVHSYMECRLSDFIDFIFGHDCFSGTMIYRYIKIKESLRD